MALDKLVKSGTQSNWGFIEKGNFASAPGVGENYVIVEGPMPSIDYGVIQVQEPRHGRGRGYDINDGYITQKSGTRVISFSDMIVRTLDLADLVYAVTQIVVEGAAGVFQKDFDIANSTEQPDFGSSAGYFADIYIDNVLASKDQTFKSCILRTLTLSSNTSEGDGRLRASGEWISGFSSNEDVSIGGGTPAFNGQTYYEFSSPSKQQIAGLDVTVMDWTLTINNNAVRSGNDSSGDCDSYSCGMPYDVTGSITVKWDTNTDEHLINWLAGTAELIQLSVGTAAATGYFDIQVPKAEYTGHERNYEDQRGQLVTLPFKGGFNTSSNDMVNLQIDDSNDRTW